jgi:amino acid transporter
MLSKVYVEDNENVSEDMMGYVQELKRGMGSFMSFTIGFTEVAALVSISSMFTYGLSSGGPVVMIWGWLLTFFMTTSIAYNFAEICSVFPMAGSVYCWSGVLAPRRLGPVFAYWTGLFNLLGNIAGDSSFAFILSQFVSAALATGGFEALTTEQMVGLAIAVLFVWSVMNSFYVESIGWVNNFAAIFHISTIIALVAVVLTGAPSLNMPDFVFFGFNNSTTFMDSYHVVFLSSLFGCFGFVGYDASAHMAEETKGSRVAAPRGIVYTDDDYTNHSHNSVIQIILQCSNQQIASLFAWLIVVNIFFAGNSSVTVTSRVMFALCRDKAMIFSDMLATIHPTLHTPINTLIALFVIQSVLVLIPLASTGGPEAFTSIVSICVVGLQISYAIPISCKVFSFLDPEHHKRMQNIFSRSSMNLGVLSFPLGVISSSWLYLTSVIQFLPLSSPVDQTTMNYSCVVVGAIIVFGLLNWQLNSKHHFKGPHRSDDDMIQEKNLDDTSIEKGDDATIDMIEAPPAYEGKEDPM